MKISQINKMTKGWFVGNFEPTLYKTNDVEVAVKEYKAGDFEGKHFHKIATEITVVISGVVLMNGIEYKAGDIIIIEPNEVADFKALTNSKNVVVKLPGANNDKYIVNE
jgi:hypothetical protein